MEIKTRHLPLEAPSPSKQNVCKKIRMQVCPDQKDCVCNVRLHMRKWPTFHASNKGYPDETHITSHPCPPWVPRVLRCFSFLFL